MADGSLALSGEPFPSQEPFPVRAKLQREEGGLMLFVFVCEGRHGLNGRSCCSYSNQSIPSAAVIYVMHCLTQCLWYWQMNSSDKCLENCSFRQLMDMLSNVTARINVETGKSGVNISKSNVSEAFENIVVKQSTLKFNNQRKACFCWAGLTSPHWPPKKYIYTLTAATIKHLV